MAARNNADKLRVQASPPNPEGVSAEGRLWPPWLFKAGPRLCSVCRQLLQLLTVGALAVACYFFISRFFVQSVTVVGMSMAPTLTDSERYLLNKWVYYVRSPRANDLVVLRDPVDKGFSVKRIVAVEGESVIIRNGSLTINGRKAVEPYLRPGTPTLTAGLAAEQVFKCPPGHYFVLGDNRNNSVDSRAYGPVARKDILGLVVH